MDHVRCLSLWFSLYMARSCLLNARKTIRARIVCFVVVDVSDGDFVFFLFFCFFRCFSFSHSRARILMKSSPGRPPDCRLLGPPFLVLVQGFSIKVLMQKYCLHDDSCSRTRILYQKCSCRTCLQPLQNRYRQRMCILA